MSSKTNAIKYTSTSKLVFDIIEKLRGTSKQFIDFILFLSQFQDENARCSNVYYKDVIEATGTCEQTFYNNLYWADKLGIIKIYYDLTSTKENVWHFCFVDNLFYSKGKKISKRYLNTNLDILYSSAFRELKLNEKILTLCILSLGEIRKFKNKRLSYETLMNYANTDNIDLLEQYLDSLKKFFNITYIDDDLVEIKLPEYFSPNINANTIYARHTLRAYCRRCNVTKYDEEEFNSTANTIEKFLEYHFELVLRVIRRVLKLCGTINSEYIYGKIIDSMRIEKEKRKDAKDDANKK